ncbi:uncharacterized protein EI97DRAFT_502896 [Westerdykella ornata]|uniref:FZ domain-containing protein n=1 Tax=Westerdykella ornata TaxID=318751 RepID=A0A6A6JGD6_WESOR|nr:uncharacterized protein EI97DRAFT_502896 [Westerdykella ornata]KAF2274279.1 hypothetical protein EI97DRAFT_502896 [Westerdykella ornata]
MPLTKRPPLQLRRWTSVLPACLLLIAWIPYPSGTYVHAAEQSFTAAHVDSGRRSQVLPPTLDIGVAGIAVDEEKKGRYVGEFAYFEPSLIGRAPEGVEELKDGEKKNMESNPGVTKHFVLGRSELRRRASIIREDDFTDESAHPDNTTSGTDAARDKRQSGTTVYISINTCRQPIPDVPIMIDPPPQLRMYISTSTDNQQPGPNKDSSLATDPIDLQGGAATFSLQTDSDVYIGVFAPNLTKGWTGSYGYEVAASTERFYHSYNGTDPFLYMIDTDSESALFITHNITTKEDDTEAIEKWLRVSDIPFSMYMFPKASWGATGFERSFCGIKESFEANSSSTVKVDRAMTDRYGGVLPKAQFHVQGLQKNETYVGFLVMDGNVSTDGLDLSNNLTVGRGGKVWKQFTWKTKADDSCQVIFNLPFCSTIAYAVPSSPQFRGNSTALALLYDSQAQSYYQNFTRSLAQIPCDTTATAQYSLARTCTDCAGDYKEWMCSVLMPRCEDWTATDPWLMPRNVNARFPNGDPAPGPSLFPNASDVRKGDEWEEDDKEDGEREYPKDARRAAYAKSRNPLIDEAIKPGPYKELLPCEDLCYDIVRSCPAQLGFACPVGPAQKVQYGSRDRDGGRQLRCNFPGAVVDLNTVRGEGSRRWGGRDVWVLVGWVVGIAVVGSW